MLTLRKLLETVADYDRRVEVAIETKHPTRYGGAGRAARRRAAATTSAGTGPGSPARVMSFSWTALPAGTSAWRPTLPVVMLVEQAQHWPLLRRVVGDDWILGPGIERAARPPGLGRRRSRPGASCTCGPSTPRPTSSCASTSGCKAVITDRPAYVLDLLGG